MCGLLGLSAGWGAGEGAGTGIVKSESSGEAKRGAVVDQEGQVSGRPSNYGVGHDEVWRWRRRVRG